MKTKSFIIWLVLILAFAVMVYSSGLIILNSRADITLFSPEMFEGRSPGPNVNVTGNYSNLSVYTNADNVTNVSFLWYLMATNSLELNVTVTNTTGNQTNWNTTWTLNATKGFISSALRNGVYNLTFCAQNMSFEWACNNVTSRHNEHVSVDNSPPNVTIVSPTGTPAYTITTGNITFHATIKDYPARVARNMTFSFSNGTYALEFGFNSTIARNNSLTDWNVSYNVSALHAGTHTVRIFAYDNFGLLNSTETFTFTLNTPFNTTIVGSPDGKLFGWGTGRPYNNGMSNFSINVSINGNITWIDTIYLMFNNNTDATVGSFNISIPVAHGDTATILANLSYNLSMLRPGTRTVRLWVNDSKGNINQSQTASFEVNRQLNVTWLNLSTTKLSINTSGVIYNYSTGNKTFNLSVAGNFTGTRSAEIKYVILQFDNASGKDFNYTLDVVDEQGGKGVTNNGFTWWSPSYNISTLHPGTNSVTIWVNDSLDNRNATETLTFNLNSWINVTHPSTSNGRPFNLHSDNATFNVTANLNLTNISAVILMFNNASGADFNVTVFAQRPNTLANAYGKYTSWVFSYNVSRLAEGNNTVTIFVNDSAGGVGGSHGNNQNATETITFYTDYTAPATTVTRSSSSTTSKLVLDVATATDVIYCEDTKGQGSITGSGSSYTLTYTGLTAGTSYTFNMRCVDELSNNVTESVTFATDSDTTSGSGTSGSGGGSSAGITGQFGKEVWASINAGETATVEVDNGVVGVTEVSFVAPSTVYGAWVKVAKVDGLPSSMASFSGAVYKNIEITKGVALKEDNIKDAVIDFKVEKTWLTAKGLTQNQVAIYRYVDSKWTELGTTFVKDDGTYVHYTATTPGFSYFIIGEKGVGAAAEVPAGEVPAGEVPAGEVAGEVPAGEVAGEAAQKITWPWVVAIALVVIIAAFVIIYLKRRR
ncbi:MAG: PGF-pre-PGF domain-containing protein [Nanoarchaeota archaeon]